MSALAPSTMNSRQNFWDRAGDRSSCRSAPARRRHSRWRLRQCRADARCRRRSIPSAATRTRSLRHAGRQSGLPGGSSLDRSEAIHPAMRSPRATNRRTTPPDLEVPSPAATAHRPRADEPAPELARRYVDQHQVHRPAAEPILGLGRPPSRQLTHGRHSCAGAAVAHRPCRRGSRSFLASCPALAGAPWLAAIAPTNGPAVRPRPASVPALHAGRQTEVLE